MISTFEQFVRSQVSSTSLSTAEQESLRNAIMDWPSTTLAPAVNVLSDYFGIVLPDKFLKQVLMLDLDLALETFTDSISDTCQREMLIDTVVKALGISDSWPTFGTSSDRAEKFFSTLQTAVLNINGEVL